MESTAFTIVSLVSIGFLSLMLFLALFEPGLRYEISERPSLPLDSEEFLRLLSSLGGAQIHPCNTVEVLTNGERYYQAELEAIRKARHSVNVEAYIFTKGRVTRTFLDALTDRARAGVKVRMVVDAVGSFTTWRSYFKELE